MTDFKMNLSMLARPDYRAPSAWSGHLAFAGWVVEEHRPSVMVELGTHWGLSFMAFCQAVMANGIDCRCFAVDTWQGDPHAGVYGEEVFSKVSSYRASRYAGFSELLRMRFDDALEYFEDGSVDLLHIDGMHTYEAVKHDFETWLPKLSERAVVLLHDTSVREREFGVWRYWDELREKYPSFEFTHSHGLGVITLREDTLPALTGLDEASVSFVRRLFYRLGEREEVDMEIARLNEALDHERGVRRALVSMVGREPVMGSDEWSTLRHDIAHVSSVVHHDIAQITSALHHDFAHISATLRADLAHITHVVQYAQEATVNALKPPQLESEAPAAAEPEGDPVAMQRDGDNEEHAPIATEEMDDAPTAATAAGQDDLDLGPSSAAVSDDASIEPGSAVQQDEESSPVGSPAHEREPHARAGNNESGRNAGSHALPGSTQGPQDRAAAKAETAPPSAD